MDELQNIQNLIFEFRGQRVMIDHDLAHLYGVATKALNQAVKRNIRRFPEDFMFRLSDDETQELVTICDRLRNLKHSGVNPQAFTQEGVAMLSGVLTLTLLLRQTFLSCVHLLWHAILLLILA